MSQLLIEKYHPKSSAQILGNTYALTSLANHIQSKIPTVIIGPPGSGKTTATHLLLKEHAFNNVINIDCFDSQCKSKLDHCLRALRSNPVSMNGKSALVLDDIDGCDPQIITALKQFITKCKSKPAFPIIVIGNDSSSKQCRAIRAVSTAVWFNPVSSYDIAKRLCKIHKREQLQPFTRRVLESINAIADSCRGDVRSAIIQLENSNYQTDKVWTNPFKTIEYIMKPPRKATFESLTYAAESDLFLMTGMVHEHVNDINSNTNNINNINTQNTLDDISYVYDTLGLVDVISSKNTGYDIQSSLVGNCISNAGNRCPSKFRFPSSLGKYSAIKSSRQKRTELDRFTGHYEHSEHLRSLLSLYKTDKKLKPLLKALLQYPSANMNVELTENAIEALRKPLIGEKKQLSAINRLLKA
jgi:hypothetical protein